MILLLCGDCTPGPARMRPPIGGAEADRWRREKFRSPHQAQAAAEPGGVGAWITVAVRRRRRIYRTLGTPGGVAAWHPSRYADKESAAIRGDLRPEWCLSGCCSKEI